MVRESWEQFSAAARWIEGIAESQVTALTAMMMWLLTVRLPAAANLGEFYKHEKHETVDTQPFTRFSETKRGWWYVGALQLTA